MTTPELLPCPFCGGEAYTKDYGAYHEGVWIIGCPSDQCPAEAAVVDTLDAATRAWNTRAPLSPAVLAELPEVRALIRQAVDKAVRIVMDEVGYEEEDLCESCRDSLAAIREGRG
jgi:hypothetical protein